MQIEIGILGLLGVAFAGFIGGAAACGLATWGFHRLLGWGLPDSGPDALTARTRGFKYRRRIAVLI